MTWWRRVVRRRRLERELDRELQDHIDRQVADYVASGLGEADARRRVRLEFGGVDQVKEDCRDARGTRWIDDAVQDVRYGCRILAGSRMFTLVAVLSLALGIGANTAIFSLVNSLLLRTLPVREPQRLVLLEGGSWTNPIWEQVRDRQRAIFAGAFAWGHERFDMGRGGEAQSVQGLWASGGLFEVLGVPAVLGRTLTAADDRRGGGSDGFVAVISYRFWQSRYGGAADVLGRTIDLNRIPFTIVGVAPPDFFGPEPGIAFDVAVPIAAAESFATGPESRLDGRSTWWLNIIGRLGPSQTAAQAAAALHRVQPQIREATLPAGWPPDALDSYLREPIQLVPAGGGRSTLRERYQRPLLVVMVVVGLVLLIACANLANLLLARAHSRRHELAMRRALGASGLRLARQLLTESLLLATAGAALGLLVAHWCSRLLLAQLSTRADAVFLDLTLDWRVLAFTTVVAAVTALLFGVAPAFIAGRIDAAEALKENGRGTGAGRRALGQPLVVVQVALSLVLIVAAGLFVRSFVALATVDLGFERSPVLVVNIDALRSHAPASDRPALFERARQAVAVLPGVSRAAVSVITPVSGRGWNDQFDFPGLAQLPRQDRMVWMNAVTPGWFHTYGTSLVAGRDFDDRDRAGAPKVVIVNDAFVRRFLKGTPPLGARIRSMPSPRQQPPALEIVGVVRNAAYRSVRETASPTAYVPLAQLEKNELPPFASISVRAAQGSPASLVKSIAAALSTVDADFSLTFVPLQEQVNASLTRERLLAMLSGFFGGLALLLAGVGIYGVAACAVSLRRTEIGIRMALGATSAGVLRLVVGRIGILLGAGVIAGVLVSAWAARFVGTLLYGLQPRDPVTLLGATVVLVLIGTFAAWLPARRAARIDPAEVLREG
jgi:putative ABC transport system permease protein